MDVARMTRMFTVCAALALGVCALAAASSEAAVDTRGAVPATYRYSLMWFPRERELRGRGYIGVDNRGPAETSTVWLRLRPNYPGQLERISNLRGASISERRAYSSMVKLRLRRPLAVGARARFDFNFKLKVPKDETSLGRSAGMDLFGDALPIVAVEGPRGVRMGTEPSYGEGSFSEVAAWDLSLWVPDGLRVVLPGEQWFHDELVWVKGGDMIPGKIFKSRARVRDAAFAIGRYSSLSQVVGATRIQVVAAPELKSRLPAALRRAVNAFTKLQRWYGGYHLPTLRIVLGDLDFGGSEYPGLVFSTPDNATIAHEVAHQWFYGLVGNDQYNDPFLDESLTAFAEQRFHKSYRCNLASPLDGHAHGLGTGMAYWQNHAADYEHTIYRGGACALTVLRRDIGATAFDQALRAYVAANADELAGVDDFLAAIRNAAPTYDLARWEKLVGLS